MVLMFGGSGDKSTDISSVEIEDVRYKRGKAHLSGRVVVSIPSISSLKTLRGEGEVKDLNMYCKC